MGGFEHFNRIRRANHAARWAVVKDSVLAECPLLAAMKARDESAERILEVEEQHSAGRVHYCNENDPGDVGCAKLASWEVIKTKGVVKTQAQQRAHAVLVGKEVA